jgi:site-specific DNA recombinase
MVKDGVAEMDDILGDRINSLQLDRDRIQSSLDQVRTHAIPTDAIPEHIIAEFGSIMWENTANGEVPFRKHGRNPSSTRSSSITNRSASTEASTQPSTQ